jgi:hypothetical protein
VKGQDKAASVRARLLNKAKADERDFNPKSRETKSDA